MSEQPVDRRTALLAALDATGAFWLLRDTLNFDERRIAVEPTDEVKSSVWSIRGGEGLGPISLGQSSSDVIACFGKPTDESHFPGVTAEEMQAAFRDQYDPKLHVPFEARSFLQYHDLGVDFAIRESAVWYMCVYTGHKAGYETGVHQGFNGCLGSMPLSLATESVVLTKFGKPTRQGENPHAPIPIRWYHFHQHGLEFSFDARTGQLSVIEIVSKRVLPNSHREKR